MRIERTLFCTQFVVLVIGVINAALQNGNTYESEFQTFIKNFDKVYENNTNEYHKRLEIFQENYKISLDLNNSRTGNHSAWFGITKFSDMTFAEFKDAYLSDYIPGKLPHVNTSTSRLKASNGDLLYMSLTIPIRMDWRDKGNVTKVKNQKSCGGCWAFSSVELMESRYASQTGRLQEFSIQEVLDCSRTARTPFGSLNGCKGGQLCAALYWLQQTQTTVVDELSYKLRDSDHYCRMIPRSAHGIKVLDFHCYNFTYHESEILRYLATEGPVSVAVDASNWHNYMGGIIQYNCPANLNHAVQVVGYDMSGPVPHYIVRNSWGTDWGINGYIHLRYNHNMCGIAEEVTMVNKILVV